MILLEVSFVLRKYWEGLLDYNNMNRKWHSLEIKGLLVLGFGRFVLRYVVLLQIVLEAEEGAVLSLVSPLLKTKLNMIQQEMECNANNSDTPPSLAVWSFLSHVNTALDGKCHCDPAQYLHVIMSMFCQFNCYAKLQFIPTARTARNQRWSEYC